MAVQVKDLLKSTAALSRPGPSYRNQYLDPGARPDSPPLRLGHGFSLLEPGPDFVPIFSRRRRPRSGRIEVEESKMKGKERMPQGNERRKLLFFEAPKGQLVNMDDVHLALSGPPPRSFAQLPMRAKLHPVKVEDDEPDLRNESMKIVDGWSTFLSVSSSLPSQLC